MLLSTDLSTPVAPAEADSPEQVTLTQRRVYIVPTRPGLAFAVTLLLMLAGSINYNLGLGYVLTFLLCGLAVVGMLHTWRNLAGLSLTRGRATPAFAGDPATVRVRIRNPGSIARPDLRVSVPGADPGTVGLAPRETLVAELAVPTRERGRLLPGRVQVVTTFPLGLFRAWAYAELDLAVLVYPRPEPEPPALPEAGARRGTGARSAAGEDDFAGVRDYVRGDSPRRIAWKAAARGDTLLTKQFAGGAGGPVILLDWYALTPGLGTEPALSRLTAWLLLAEAHRLRYGLRLPEVEFAPATGPAHRERCLEALALHGRQDA